MDCYVCKTELIWGGDEDGEEEDVHSIVTNLSCPECDAMVVVYWGQKENE